MARIKTLDTSKGKSYNYSDLEFFAERNGLEIIDHGPFIIGENFVVFKNPETGSVISTMLTGQNSDGGIFHIIYSDIASLGFDEEK